MCSIYVWNVVAKFVKLKFFFFFREHPNNKAVLEDVGQNTDLYIANTPIKNQESRGQHAKLGD